MGDRTKVLLVGAGGYGNFYVNDILDKGKERDTIIVGVVDPNPRGCNTYDDLIQERIPIYGTMEEFYLSNKADLAVISSPIHFHCAQVCTALLNGSHVLCEKPISATPEEARIMMEMQKATGLKVGIGYQWSFSQVMRELKKDIQQGLLGRPILLKTMVLWPRNKQYYARGWAGKMADDKGNPIRDSIANNATAHYLHNMFFVLGETEDKSAIPETVQAELYRANQIENFDTAVVRIKTKCGTELLYYGTHAVNQSKGPVFQYEFENAVVFYGDGEGKKEVFARFHDGRVKNYGDPSNDDMNKLWTMIEAIYGNATIPCNLQTAFSHTLCIDAMQKSVPVIPDFPASLRNYDEDREVVWIDGLFDIMDKCYRNRTLPSESGVKWASIGNPIQLSG